MLAVIFLHCKQLISCPILVPISRIQITLVRKEALSVLWRKWGLSRFSLLHDNNLCRLKKKLYLSLIYHKQVCVCVCAVRGENLSLVLYPLPISQQRTVSYSPPNTSWNGQQIRRRRAAARCSGTSALSPLLSTPLLFHLSFFSRTFLTFPFQYT